MEEREKNIDTDIKNNKYPNRHNNIMLEPVPNPPLPPPKE